MQRFSRSHLSDQGLVSSLAANAGRERASTAEFLADIAEFDARKLYLPAGYDSMFAYCVGELHLSDDAAYKRIKAARAARRFPAIFATVADGRLHLSAVVLLAPHLVEDTAGELLAAATHKTKSEIERLVAERFPRPDVPAWVHSIATASPATTPVQQAPGPVETLSSITLAPAPVAEAQAPMPVDASSPAASVDDHERVKPLATGRFAVQFTMGQSAHDKLQYAQELLSHEIPSGDLEQVFEQALDALIPQLEKRKFAATTSPRPGHGRPTKSLRHIPVAVMRRSGSGTRGSARL